MSVSASEVPFVSFDALKDALVLALSALQSAYDELTLVVETPVPLPDDVENKLLEREALLDALNAAPEDWKPRLRELFVEAHTPGACTGLDAGCPTLLPGVLAGLGDAWETLRRAGLVDPGVRAALREADIQ